MRIRSNSSAYKTFSSVACGTQNTTEQTKPAVASRQRQRQQHRQRQRQQAKLVLVSSCICSCSCSCLRASCSLVLSAAAAVATRSPIRFTVVLFGIRNMCMQATAATVEPVRSIMPVWNYNYLTSAREDCGGEYLTLYFQFDICTFIFV